MTIDVDIKELSDGGCNEAAFARNHA